MNSRNWSSNFVENKWLKINVGTNNLEKKKKNLLEYLIYKYHWHLSKKLTKKKTLFGCQLLSEHINKSYQLIMHFFSSFLFFLNWYQRGRQNEIKTQNRNE